MPSQQPLLSVAIVLGVAVGCGDGSGGDGTGNSSPTSVTADGSGSASDSASTDNEPTEGGEASESDEDSGNGSGESESESETSDPPPCDGPPGSCDCADGPVQGTCVCGSNEVEGGFCCGGLLQEGACDGDATLAFPGVEGFGAHATGGRGGQVIKVTTLDATGPGSLDEALRTEGPRIVVFDVSGVINGDFEISAGDVTIAGETAPGGGITIVGRLWAPFTNPDESCTSRCGTSDVSNIVIRHVRVRHVCRAGQPDNQCDAMRFSSQSLFVFDHLSVAWGIDETLDMWGGAYDWTIQNTTFEHPCLATTEAGPNTGSPDHAYGILNRRGGYGSMLRTAMLSCRDRNPAFSDGPFDIINTVVYNHQTGVTHHNPPSGDFSIIGNYYKWGPAGGVGKPFWLSDSTEPMFWFEDSIIDDQEGVLEFDDPWTTAHPQLGGEQMGNVPESQRATERPDYASIDSWVAPNILPASEAYTVVLDTAGAFPRDVVTRTAVEEALSGAGEFGCALRTQLDGDGNPSGEHPLLEGLTPGTAEADADGDGIPDEWESEHGLDANDPSDNHTMMATGYDAIESYLHERAALLVWG
jgi:pectate lyase